MKTTFEISGNLFRRAKKLAQKVGKTFKAVVREALVTRLGVCDPRYAPIQLDIPVVSGEIHLEFINAPRDKIRDEIYPTPFPNAPLIALGMAAKGRKLL